MNALFKAIWDRFATTTDSGFYNDISGRMYHNVAPQGASFPYCVFFSIADTNELDFGEEREDFLIQFNIFSKKNSAIEAGNLLESLKTMFDNCDLTVTNWRHVNFQRDFVIPNNDFTQDTPIQGYSVQYNALIEKTR